MYNVMIVDDEYAIRENLPLLIDFNLYGFKVACTAKNGAEALNRLYYTKIDLIVLDSKMPEMDGLQFLKKLSETEFKSVEIIILSGYSDFYLAQQAFHFNVNSYLTKPVDEDEFCVLLKDIKKRLDDKIELTDRKRDEETVVALKVIYHTNSKIAKLENYGIISIIPIALDENSDESPYDIVIKTTDELFGKMCFKQRGFTYSMLVSRSVIEKNRGLNSLVNTLKDKFDSKKLKAEILFDESIMKSNENSFKKNYDNYVDNVITELFYKNSSIDDDKEQNKYNDYLGGILKQVEMLDENSIQALVSKFFISVKQSKLSISEIVKLTDKLYYMLENTVLSSESESKNVVERVNILDYNLFVDFEIWCDIINSLITETVNRLNGGLDKINRSRFNPVIEYVNNNFNKQLTIKEVASKFYLNSSYLGRMFKKTTGVSFNKYINDLRVEKAKKMLTQSDARIYEISSELGYAESKHFITKFTQEVGVTPGEYRKNIY